MKYWIPQVNKLLIFWLIVYLVTGLQVLGATRVGIASLNSLEICRVARVFGLNHWHWSVGRHELAAHDAGVAEGVGEGSQDERNVGVESGQETVVEIALKLGLRPDGKFSCLRSVVLLSEGGLVVVVRVCRDSASEPIEHQERISVDRCQTEKNLRSTYRTITEVSLR